MPNIKDRFDRAKASDYLQTVDRDELADASEGILDYLASCVTPDQRIARISLLCKQAEPYGYVRIEAIREVLRSGS
jgi:hypothetical protein